MKSDTGQKSTTGIANNHVENELDHNNEDLANNVNVLATVSAVVQTSSKSVAGNVARIKEKGNQMERTTNCPPKQAWSGRSPTLSDHNEENLSVLQV